MRILSLQTDLTAYMFLRRKTVPALANNLITLISAKPQAALSESVVFPFHHRGAVEEVVFH